MVSEGIFYSERGYSILVVFCYRYQGRGVYYFYEEFRRWDPNAFKSMVKSESIFATDDNKWHV
jgi:hypothetical protein